MSTPTLQRNLNHNQIMVENMIKQGLIQRPPPGQRLNGDQIAAIKEGVSYREWLDKQNAKIQARKAASK